MVVSTPYLHRFETLSDTSSNTGADAAVKIWDTGTGKLVHTFEGHLAGISTVAWSPDGETIASGSDDKSIRLWNVLTVGSAVWMTVMRLLTSA